MAFLAPLAPYALPALGSAAAGLGIGFGADKLAGDGKYSAKEAAIDGGLGLFGGVGGGALKGLLRSAGWNAARMSPGAGSAIARQADRGMINFATRGAGLGGLIFQPQKNIGPVPMPGLGMTGPTSGSLVQGPGLGHHGDYWTGGGINEAPDIYGGLGSPPSFSKTLEDYLQDPTLRKLADAEIIKMNSPLVRANKARNRQMIRETGANEDAGQNVVDQIGQIRRENAQQVGDINQSAQAGQQRVVQEANKLAGDVGASIVSDDRTRQDLQSQAGQHAQDLASRQEADSQLLQRMAGAGQNSLAELASAEAMQTRSNAQAIRQSAAEDIRSNSEQVRANWHERSGILGSLADTALQRDLQAHQMGLQAWSARLDALNSYRSNQLEQQKLQGGGMDPQMLSLMLGAATKGSGYTQKGTTEDGQEWSYEAPMYSLWDPQQLQKYNQMLSPIFGGANVFTTPALPTMG